MKLRSADEKSAKITFTPKCGDCMHFDHYAKFQSVCSKLGVLKNRLAPPCFTENVFVLQKQSPDVLNQIGLLLKDFTPSQARILLAILAKKKKYKEYGLAFGMPVYFHLGSDYLNNYFKGYVVGVANRGEPMVYVSSDLNKKQVNKPAMLALYPDSVFTISQFEKKKKSLADNNRLNDPKITTIGKKNKTEISDVFDFEPPTLEAAPASWFDIYSKVGKEKANFKKGKNGIEFQIK